MRYNSRRAFITGLGAVSCLGRGVEEFWQALLSGRCGLRPITRFDLEGSPYGLAGEVEAGGEQDFREAGGSLGAQFAAVAAEQALSGVPADERHDLAIVLSTNFGPSEVIEAFLDGALRTDDRWPLSEGPYGWDVDYVARRIGAGGEGVNVSLSCSSGNAALAYALGLIRAGAAEWVLAGGYDSIQKVIWAGLAALRVMAVGKEGQDARVRPFDAGRSGTVFSEGAGMLLLESEAHMRARGVAPLAEVAGAGSNNNAYHLTHADRAGRATAEVIQMALDDAAVEPERIGYINAHGTGTRLNDAIESRAIHTVFGERARQMPVTSLKGGLGHAMAAASALEAVASVLSLRNALIPPTINYEAPDPECDVRVVASEPLEADLQAVLNNSAGIGGGNAAVVFTRAD